VTRGKEGARGAVGSNGGGGGRYARHGTGVQGYAKYGPGGHLTEAREQGVEFAGIVRCWSAKGA
jgi:hypothetical protein